MMIEVMRGLKTRVVEEPCYVRTPEPRARAGGQAWRIAASLRIPPTTP